MKQGKRQLNAMGGILLTREEALGLVRESKGYRKYRRLTPQMQEELLGFLWGKEELRSLMTHSLRGFLILCFIRNGFQSCYRCSLGRR